MRSTWEAALGDELAELVRAGPPTATRPFRDVEPSAYTCERTHRDEVAAITRHPAAVLAASELAAPGDFVTLELGGVPVIVSRDRDGVVHAMRNVCAHRGSTVETRTDGSARIFSCGFHGWSYELDGSLRAVSKPTLFSTEPCTTGLRRLPCDERHGVIWVTADPDGDSEVRGWLGEPLDDLLADLGMGAMVHHAATTFELDCNWKLLTDGFLEIYHLKFLHRDSIAPYFPADLTKVGRSGRHFVNWLPKNRLVTELTER
ncbi:MAG: aromatic ring-hydroxylating dioxygenase subunit alpha, partial [Actinomycetota bacterium]